jgi:hypothetical protein
MGWLARLKEWLTRNPVGQVDDEVLGPLVLNDGDADGYWVARATAQGRPVLFLIGGRYEPDPALIARARDIFGSLDRFVADVTAFLAAEAEQKHWTPFADEIRALTIQDICLFWPSRPDEGMIFFAGTNPDLCWRCHLNGRTPVGLNFDS